MLKLTLKEPPRRMNPSERVSPDHSLRCQHLKVALQAPNTDETTSQTLGPRGAGSPWTPSRRVPKESTPRDVPRSAA